MLEREGQEEVFPVPDEEVSLPALDGLGEHFFCRQKPYRIHYGHVYICSLEDLTSTISLDGPSSLVWLFLFPCGPSNKTCPGPLTETMEPGVGLLSSDRSEKVYHLKGK